MRVEYETLTDLIAEPGLHYEYLIELDAETTLIVHTTETRGVEGVYEENRPSSISRWTRCDSIRRARLTHASAPARLTLRVRRADAPTRGYPSCS